MCVCDIHERIRYKRYKCLFDSWNMRVSCYRPLYDIWEVIFWCHKIRVLCAYVLIGECAECNNGEGNGYSLGSRSSWPHHFSGCEAKRDRKSIKKASKCETLLKNLVGNAGLAVCLHYDYVYKYKYGCIFWDETCVRTFCIWFKFICNVCLRTTDPNFR